MQIHELNSGSASGSNYLAQDDGTDTSKLTISALAKWAVETYAGSTLAGVAQSIKAAIDSLNTSKQPKTMSQTIAGQTTVEGCLDALNSNFNGLKNPVIVTIPTITFGTHGFANVSTYKPSHTGTFLFALLWDCDASSSNDAVTLLAGGGYLMGSANATVTNVKVAYFYDN